MTKQELPQCSVPGCESAAGVIMDGTLLCGAHANEALERRRATIKPCKRRDDNAD